MLKSEIVEFWTKLQARHQELELTLVEGDSAILAIRSNDWQKRKCRECGYFWYTDELSDNETGTRMLINCGCSTKPTRSTMPHTEACPDCVLRQTPEDNDHARL